MAQSGSRFGKNLAAIVALAAGIAAISMAQSSDDRWWTGYGNGPDSSRYVASRQINRSNVQQLQVAWTYPYGDTGSVPIVVRGVVYGRGRNGSLVAVDAKTGKELWIRENMPVMLDNLIYEKRIPPIVAVLLSPGPGGQRTIEYDTISDRYLNFVETEVLPRITRDYQVAFTSDPDGRATFGESSGSPAALNMAWLYPNLYRRVISYSGTFVALQRNATAPNGAWDYHDKFIPTAERKPIRIWLHVSGNDNGATATAESLRNWIIANTRMRDRHGSAERERRVVRAAVLERLVCDVGECRLLLRVQ